MIAVGSNILVYAHRGDSEFHRAAASSVTTLAEGRARWALPWPCVHEFIAIVTHPRIYDPPSAVTEAVDQVDAWLESPSAVLIGEEAGYWKVARGLILEGRAAGPLVHDARVAALCLAHGVTELLSADRDFSRFPQVRTTNPLV